MGLLGDIYSASDTLKRKLRGLLADPVGEVQLANTRAVEDAKTSDKRRQRMITNPSSISVADTADAFNSASAFAPLGMTVWHGSPHKFNKFDMSKIGTGEGAQAYGHGLYMAESPEVAKTYQQVLGGTEKQYYLGGKQIDPRMMDAYESNAIDQLAYGKTPEKAIADLEDQGVQPAALAKMKSLLDDFHKQGVKMVETPKANSSLYKVDIPDEAVARFLDWDKPLSQQAPEVQKALQNAGLVENGQWGLKGKTPVTPSNATGSDLWTNYMQAMDVNGAGSRNIAPEVSKLLNNAGIPGIRYLDGGSRSAGQGSSNFVLFDDQLPRILETNGVPTGQVPWKPGEWGGLLGGAK